MTRSLLYCLIIFQLKVLTFCALICRRCDEADGNLDSDCRKGTLEKTTECWDGHVCYEEYYEESHAFHFVRGCAPTNWCEREKNFRGDDLKMCNTCNSKNCNTKLLGEASLVCQKCSSTEYDSDCRKGTEKNTIKCMKEGACYEEYIMNRPPEGIYRRGCATKNWCQYQITNHGDALKWCNTCTGNNCNKHIFGSYNSSMLQCHTCISVDGRTPCRYGHCYFPIDCKEGQNRCFVEYTVRTTYNGHGRNYYSRWIRGCGEENHCSKYKEKKGEQLLKCVECENDLCNTFEMPNDY